MLLASASGRQSASAELEVEEREVSRSGQTDVESQGFLVRQLSHFSAIKLVLIKTRPLIGRSRRLTYYAHIRGEVPFARQHVKQARSCHNRRLAVTSS